MPLGLGKGMQLSVFVDERTKHVNNHHCIDMLQIGVKYLVERTVHVPVGSVMTVER